MKKSITTFLLCCLNMVLISVGGEPPVVPALKYCVMNSGETIEFPYATEVSLERILSGSALVLLVVTPPFEEIGTDFVEVGLKLIVKNNDEKQSILFPRIDKRYKLEINRITEGSLVDEARFDHKVMDSMNANLEIKPSEIAIQHLSVKIKREKHLKAVGIRLEISTSNLVTNWVWTSIAPIKQ